MHHSGRRIFRMGFTSRTEEKTAGIHIVEGFMSVGIRWHMGDLAANVGFGWSRETDFLRHPDGTSE